MKYCKLCLQPDTRPNEVFSNQGICFACINYSKNKELDYASRFHILKILFLSIEKNLKIFLIVLLVLVGVKDSTRQAIWVRDKLGLKPLLVSLVYPPQQVNNLGAQNLSNLIELGFDVLISSQHQSFGKNL